MLFSIFTWFKLCCTLVGTRHILFLTYPRNQFFLTQPYLYLCPRPHTLQYSQTKPKPVTVIPTHFPVWGISIVQHWLLAMHYIIAASQKCKVSTPRQPQANQLWLECLSWQWNLLWWAQVAVGTFSHHTKVSLWQQLACAVDLIDPGVCVGLHNSV